MYSCLCIEIATVLIGSKNNKLFAIYSKSIVIQGMKNCK